MRLPNFKKMSDNALNAYKKAIEKELKTRGRQEERRKQRAMEKLLKLAEKEGISVSELRAAGRKSTTRRKTTAKVKPKYRNPQDPSMTWSGRGRKPAWVQTHLDKGGKLEELAI